MCALPGKSWMSFILFWLSRPLWELGGADVHSGHPLPCSKAPLMRGFFVRSLLHVLEEDLLRKSSRNGFQSVLRGHLPLRTPRAALPKQECFADLPGLGLVGGNGVQRTLNRLPPRRAHPSCIAPIEAVGRFAGAWLGWDGETKGPDFVGALLNTGGYSPQTSSDTCLIRAIFFHWSSGSMMLPSSVEEKPH